MRSNCFTRILDETTIELNESFKDTVDRLIAQQGVCREMDSQGDPLEFTCTKKGKFRVYNARSAPSNTSNRMYYVRGHVFTENGKTKVTIYTVHDRTATFLRWAVLFGDLLLWVLYVLVLLLNNTLIYKGSIFALLLLTGGVILIFLRTQKEQQYKSADLDIMKNEIMKRVEAVKRWHD